MKFRQTSTIFLLTLFKLATGFLRVCYYTNWSQYRPDGGKFTPDHVNPALCSHIIYAFAKVEGNTLTAHEWNDESTAWTTGMYAQINNMKKKHPHLKTLIAVGGWNAGSASFSNIAMTAASRKEFVNNTQHFLRERDFDGLDIDWEYPTKRGGRPEDKQNLVLLLKDMATAFEHDAYHTGRPKLLLSAAVPAGKQHIDAGFNIPSVARSLDFINVMTYDLHGSWESVTGHNSPLFARAGETGADATMNIEWALNHWARMGAPKHKLIVGLGIYGRSFKLENPLNNGIGALTVGPGRMGNFSKEDGFMAYYEVCQELSKGAIRVWNAEHKVPYMYNGDLWVGYDDEQSVREKVKWTRQQGFGGMMVWSMALDDFSGTMCNKGPYPLLTAINDELKHPAQPKTMDFIDPTAGGTNKAALSGPAATSSTAVLTNPPEAHAFEHRPADSHTHQMHTPPILTNMSGIDLKQLSSLPHISIIDHPRGTSHSPLPQTTPKPSPSVPNTISFPSQTSLADLFAELIHAPANHQKSHHHNHAVGGPNLMDFPAPTEPVNHQTSPHHDHNMGGHTNIVNVPSPTVQINNPPPLVPSLQDLMPAAVPSPPGTVNIREVQRPPSVLDTLPQQVVPIANTIPDSHMIGNANTLSDIGALRALGNIGVIPAVGRLGDSLGHIDTRGDIPNISFSSSSNSNSSSSSSTSSSNSNSRNVSIGIPGQSSNRLNLQDVLNSERSHLPDSLVRGRDMISPGSLGGLSPGSGIPGDSIFSILDGGLPATQRIELPSGSVGTVIPIANDDNLVQILSSLGVSLPTANNVLLPEESIVLTPDRILDELAIGNVLQAGTNTRIPSLQQPQVRRLPVAPRVPTAVSRIPQGVSRIQAGNSRIPTRVPGISRIQPSVSRLPTVVTQPSIQRQRSFRTPEISRRNTIQRTRPTLTSIRPSTIRRSNSPQRRTIRLEDLIRLLERRRILQGSRSPQPRTPNRVTDTRTSRLLRTNRLQQPTFPQNPLQQSAVSQRSIQQPASVQNRLQMPTFLQQRLSRPAVSRQPIRRVPASQLRLRTQPTQSRTNSIRRAAPQMSANGLTFVSSGSLPPRLQRMFVNSG